MTGSVIGKQLNNGYPGSVSRLADAIIANRPVKSTDTVNVEFGDPVVLNSDNTYSKFGASSTVAEFAGVAVREVKQSTSYFSAQGQYEPGYPADVLERGSVTVTCQNGTPTAGGPVYIRILVNATYPNAVVGGYEAVADSTNSLLLTNAQWKTGNLDSNNVAELTLLTRNKA